MEIDKFNAAKRTLENFLSLSFAGIAIKFLPIVAGACLAQFLKSEDFYRGMRNPDQQSYFMDAEREANQAYLPTGGAPLLCQWLRMAPVEVYEGQTWLMINSKDSAVHV
ncbi:MAG: hypothetical protein FJ025_05545 [Chloroflexi bacterium]|nr:hypothetical protein [Chloroflexota bacterium]